MDTLEFNGFTVSELSEIRGAHMAGILRAIDNRADGFADCDALTDARRIGERIADGFAILNASTE